MGVRLRYIVLFHNSVSKEKFLLTYAISSNKTRATDKFAKISCQVAELFFVTIFKSNLSLEIYQKLSESFLFISFSSIYW